MAIDEFEQLRSARASYIEHSGYTTKAGAIAFAAAIRVLLIFPEQVSLPGEESFRNNHAMLLKLLEKAERDISKYNSAGSAVYIHPHLRT